MAKRPKLGEVGLWAVLALTWSGCTTPATAAFDGAGYRNLQYDYRVDSKEPGAAKGKLLGHDWKLDNLYYDRKAKQQKQKDANGYVTEYEFDFNGDGRIDKSKEAFLYDLRFKHLERDAQIWLRTFPISRDLRRKDLRVLLQRYIDEISGSGFEQVKLSATASVIRERRYGAQLVERGRFKVAQRNAYQVTLDVTNVDEASVGPNARKTRVRLVLVRVPFQYAYATASGDVHFPVLMLAGYANMREDFETDEAAFQQLLESIEIGGARGTTPVVAEPLDGEDPEPEPEPEPEEAEAPAEQDEPQAPTTPEVENEAEAKPEAKP